MTKKKSNGPKLLALDIETSPLEGYFWNLFDEQGGLPMLTKDWHLLSWSARWLDPEGKTQYPMMYMDQSKAKNITDEKKILEGIWKLMDEADIIIGHNSKKFDIKKLNARFLAHGMKPPSSFRQIDTLVIARKHFAMTSNKLEYLAKKLGCNNKKLTKRQFNGMDLWVECLAGNKAAWKEMQLYNKQDVIVLEEVYKKLIPWDNSINFNAYNDEVEEKQTCSCGSKETVRWGFHYTNTGRFARFKCKTCGKDSRSKVNLLSKEKKKSLKA